MTPAVVLQDAFAARYPRCTPEQAFGPATWVYHPSDYTLVDSGNSTGVYNTNNCMPVGAGGCCDVTGAIAPSKNGRNGALFFVFLFFIGQFLSTIMTFIAASRFIFSFARDRGFPGPLNKLFSYVEPRTKIPIGATTAFLCAAIAFIACWTNPNPTVAFGAVSGISANAFLLLYGLPSLWRCTTMLKTFKPRPEFSLGRMSIPCALLGAAYGAFSNATIALPSFFPINKNTVNYAPISLAAVILMAIMFMPFALDKVNVGWGYKGAAISGEDVAACVKPPPGSEPAMELAPAGSS